MRRHWNWRIWTGFAVALVAALSYIPVFTRFPLTRDFPWVNLLLFLISGYLLAVGVSRAFAQPNTYRGKISGSILAVLSLVMLGLFVFGTLYEARLPTPRTALRVGQKAPDFSLADIEGRPVTLSQLLQGKHAVLLIFYRGYW